MGKGGRKRRERSGNVEWGKKKKKERKEKKGKEIIFEREEEGEGEREREEERRGLLCRMRVNRPAICPDLKERNTKKRRVSF